MRKDSGFLQLIFEVLKDVVNVRIFAVGVLIENRSGIFRNETPLAVTAHQGHAVVLGLDLQTTSANRAFLNVVGLMSHVCPFYTGWYPGFCQQNLVRWTARPPPNQRLAVFCGATGKNPARTQARETPLSNGRKSLARSMLKVFLPKEIHRSVSQGGTSPLRELLHMEND